MENNALIVISMIAVMLVGYLLGSISWSIILTHALQRKDIRDMGSGNAGMTNVLRTVGKGPAALTLLGDFMKCVVAVLLSQLILNWAFLSVQDVSPTLELIRIGRYLTGAACVLGHIFPVFYRFRGGKGIATAAAMVAMTDWRVFLLVIATFGLVFLWKKIISLASVICAALYPVFIFLFTFFVDFSRHSLSVHYLIFVVGISTFIGGLVIYKHRSNISRLLRGEEKPITSKKK